MRKKFEQQLSLGVVPIGEVEIREKGRHQLAPVLKAFQYIFTTPELNCRVFDLLEGHILKGKQPTGRLGMSLWEIWVLGSVRLSLDIDYDFLLDQANNHNELRGIMGVRPSDFTLGKTYKEQTLKDNVSLLDEDLLKQVNQVVVDASHGLIKKKEGAEALSLNIKADSYVVETNVHFPTDINLLWDSGRKCLDMIAAMLESGMKLPGWRQRVQQYRKFRNAYRGASEVHRKKGAGYKERLEKEVGAYLRQARVLSAKVAGAMNEGFSDMALGKLNLVQAGLLKPLTYYQKMLDKHIDLLERRVIKGEKIPHGEKVFSIFEMHTEWLNKGKLHRGVELGHNTAIASDQYNLILDFEVMFHQSDPEMGLLLGKRIIDQYGTRCILASLSFDRGFYSSLVKKILSKSIREVIMPKRGKKSLAQEQEESQDNFQYLRRAHSAVEANINQLEHNGVNRCPDKGAKNFRRYVALGVLAYNLHHLGKLVIEAEKETLLRKAA